MRGFDRSRVDIGAVESSITVEQTPVYDRDGNLIHGLASPDALEELLDVGLLAADPPVTRLGTIIQAIQSEMWSALELAADDVERQWYLRRSQDLRRFADWLRASARDMTREDLRRRLLDLMVAYGDSGSARAMRRVASSYTGQSAFVTRTRDYPGYWTVGRSFITPAHLFVPSQPIDGTRIHEASNAHPVGALGVLEVNVGGTDVSLRWKAPGLGFGPLVSIVDVGIYRLESDDPDVWVSIEANPSLIRGAAGATVADLYTVAVMTAPDTCQAHENWLPGARNLRSGVWVESFGHQAMPPEAEDEMRERLTDVADLAPLNRRRYRLEEPTYWRVPVEIAWFWEQHYANVPIAFEPEFEIPGGPGTMSIAASSGISASGGDASGGFSSLTTAVPICTGPFVTVKERFRGYEQAEVENFDLGPTFHWEARDEVVSQPVNATGLQIVELAFGMPAGRGYLSYDPVTESVSWQAPDPTGPDELDPKGSSFMLTGAAVAVDQPTQVTGVQIQNAAPSMAEGGGVLRYNAIAQSLSWQAPGDSEGVPVAIPPSGSTVLDLQSAHASWSIQARVTPGALPAGSVDETVAVHARDSVPGVALVGASARSLPGTGRIRSVPTSGGATLSWQAPGDARGPEVVADRDGSLAIPSFDGLSVLYVTVDASALSSREELATVQVAGIPIGAARELVLPSGNPLFQIRVRILGTQLQGTWVWDTIRMRTAQLTTQATDFPLPSGDGEISIFDRSFAESVRRLAWSQTANGDDQSQWIPTPTQAVVPRREGDQSLRIRIRLEPDPDFVGYPHRDQYDLVSVMIRPRLPHTEECCADDDALRLVTGGLMAACGRVTGLGIVTRGMLGYLTTVLCDGDVPPMQDDDPENPAP